MCNAVQPGVEEHYSSQFDYVSPEQYMRDELESEYNASFDDHAERYAGEALDPEYEAWCDDENARSQQADSDLEEQSARVTANNLILRGR
jgi:hypothetical protein